MQSASVNHGSQLSAKTNKHVYSNDIRWHMVWKRKVLKHFWYHFKPNACTHQSLFCKVYTIPCNVRQHYLLIITCIMNCSIVQRLYGIELTKCYILFTPYLDCMFTTFTVMISVQAKHIEPNTTWCQKCSVWLNSTIQISRWSELCVVKQTVQRQRGATFSQGTVQSAPSSGSSLVKEKQLLVIENLQQFEAYQQPTDELSW